jgi:Cu2+-exporting ATPase/Cu+-exporting ATPase
MECCDSETTPRSPPQEESADREWIKLGISALLAGNAMVVGLTLNLSTLAPNVRLFIEIALLGSTIIVFDLLGRRLLRKVWQAIIEREVTFEFLFLAGMLGALGISISSMIRGEGPVYFEVTSLLLVVYTAGDRVGRVSRQRGLEAARDWEVDDQECRRITPCGHTERVPLDAIAKGDLVAVEPGETVPVDGVIERGEGFVRDAHVTGEWASAVKRPGDRVFAGSDAIDASLVIQTEGPEGERMIDAIRASVEQAWQRPSEWQVEADRIVRWFFPAVVAFTALTFGYWAWVADWQQALFNALSVLLIACPCALGFAVPLAVWMTLGSYADAGLIARGGDVVERLARCDTAVFDKTGTLTAEAGHLVDLVAADGPEGRDRAFALARTLEQASDHPVAAAFQTGATADGGRWRLVTSRPIPGAGIEGTVRNTEGGGEQEVAVGTAALVPEDQKETFRSLTDTLRGPDGVRHLAIVADGRVIAAAAVAERPADRLDMMLDSLEAAGVRPLLVTGDRPERAHRLGFDDVYSEMKPDQKERLVDRLQKAGRRVVYIGDGVNDAGAMAAADVGIAKADGSELTVDVADVTWHGDDPTDLSSALQRARGAVSTIRSNLGYALVYNVVGIGAAAAGWLHPVFAAVLMVSSSLFVTWRTAITLED